MKRSIFRLPMILASVIFSSVVFSQEKISQMPIANPITGAELATLVQPGWNAGTCPNVGATGLCNVQISLTALLNAQFPINVTNPFTYGWGNTAVGQSVVTNSTHNAQVMGTFGTTGVIGSYASRDSVGFYFDNTAPPLVATSAGTFTATQFLPTVALSAGVVAKLRAQMIIDTNDATKFSGKILSWAANGTSITVDAWVQTGQAACGTNPGLGAGCVAGTPAGTTAFINPVTKIWAANGVITIPNGAYATSGAGIEMDLNDLSATAATNTTWGYDANNLNAAAGRDAYIARGNWDYGFQAMTSGIAGFYIPSGTSVSAGGLCSINAGTCWQVNGNPTKGFWSSQTTGTIFAATGILVSGNYINTPMFAVNYLGQADLGSLTAASVSPVVLHDSGHAGGDASISVVGGTGLSDGKIIASASSVQLGTLITIANLPTCNGGYAGAHATISNGIASPTYLQAVSATGAANRSVFCDGTGWLYD